MHTIQLCESLTGDLEASHTPPAVNLIGTGLPGIMAARGTEVDPQYRRDPKSKTSTVDPAKRRVLKSDLEKAFKHLNYNPETGQWQIGKATNNFYANDTDKTVDLKAQKSREDLHKRPAVDNTTLQKRP
ncbi:MAG: hypothetical protein EOO15_01570 [Chitinophagaceae bacterium]|nr:MAG: hypothetical protein EOO15_01570 [Chitinophagaceae bacterium]